MQDDLWATKARPARLIVEWEPDLTTDDEGVLKVSVIGKKGKVLAHHAGRWTGLMIDCLPDAFEAAAQGWLYGADPSHATLAAKNMRRSALDHAKRHA